MEFRNYIVTGGCRVGFKGLGFCPTSPNMISVLEQLQVVGPLAKNIFSKTGLMIN